MTLPLDLDRLRALAEQARSGDWASAGQVWVDATDGRVQVSNAVYAYIASLSPDVVLPLLTEAAEGRVLRGLEAWLVEENAEYQSRYGKLPTSAATVISKIARLRAQAQEPRA